MQFHELVQEIDAGQFNSEVSDKVRELMAQLNRCAQEGRTAKGGLTLKFTFSAEENGRVEINGDAAVKAPPLRRAKEVRWIGKNGALETEDPRQKLLPLKAPGRGTAVAPHPNE